MVFAGVDPSPISLLVDRPFPPTCHGVAAPLAGPHALCYPTTASVTRGIADIQPLGKRQYNCVVWVDDDSAMTRICESSASARSLAAAQWPAAAQHAVGLSSYLGLRFLILVCILPHLQHSGARLLASANWSAGFLFFFFCFLLSSFLPANLINSRDPLIVGL